MHLDFPISEMRIIKVMFRETAGSLICASPPGVYYLHKSQVEKFVKATVMLHYYNGNPYIRGNGAIGCCRRLDNILVITQTCLQLSTKDYWWTSEDLGMSPLSSRAQLNREEISERLWVHPDLLEAEKIQEEAQDSSRF